MDVKAVSAEIGKVIERVTEWSETVSPGAGARAFAGNAEGWRILTVSFPIEDQGFPKGTLGYDGTALHMERAIMCRLTREQAQAAYEAAIKGQPS